MPVHDPPAVPETAVLPVRTGPPRFPAALLEPPIALVDLGTPLEGAALIEAAKNLSQPRALVAMRGVITKVSVIPMRGRRVLRVPMRSGDVTVELWWFFASKSARALQGEVVLIGTPTLDPKKPGVLRVIHPRIVTAERLGKLEAVYLGTGSARVAQTLAFSLDRVALDRDALAGVDPLPRALAEARSEPPIGELLLALHRPTTRASWEAARGAFRLRMAWAEACWSIARRLERERALDGKRASPITITPEHHARFREALGFTLTGAQERAISTISTALEKSQPARLLLTGDVGTGKTAVLLAAAAATVQAGLQVAILAPTTALADQYADAAAAVLKRLGARLGSLVGVVAAGARRQVLDDLAQGRIDVILGTHALLADDVQFARLGLVVLDEQHRLGVGQRLALGRKGGSGDGDVAPHLLTVSATPIPRTLAIALRGEIQAVHLDEAPAGRLPIETEVLARGHWPRVLEAITKTVAAGESVFVVCATIDGKDEGESGDGDEADAEDRIGPGAKARFAELTKLLGKKQVVLAHGGLADDVRRASLKAFRVGRARVLVGTSLLEIGLDARDATLMVVDGADRFGLAQLHQLRGRVGRGERASRCLLVHGEGIAPTSQARLAAIAQLVDGLAVAREDLRLRGAGDLDGARQSGEALGFRFLDPLLDEGLIIDAEADVRALFEGSSGTEVVLQRPEHAGLKYVFDRLQKHADAQELGAVREEAG